MLKKLLAVLSNRNWGVPNFKHNSLLCPMTKNFRWQKGLASVLLVSFALPFNAPAAETYSKQDTSSYRDIYEQNVHGEIVNQLDLSRQARKIFHKPLGSKNINTFDEVPDSTFFVNRHARAALSADQLAKGYVENGGPDLTGNLIVNGGEIYGVHPSFYVKDARGGEYILKFDSAENPELSTASETIASRFYYALGYNVPQYTIEMFGAGKLKVGEGAKLRDDTGFRKPLTQDRLDEYLLFSPQTTDGSYRVAASKILAGENKGYFSLTGRRKKDPEDMINHRDRREIRALAVFAAWLNNTNVSESNTVDMVVTENGKSFLKHYLTDFNGFLGNEHYGAKPPMFGHEYTADFGEVAKSFFTLGFLEKPWQKRWREAGKKPNDSTAVGYLDNRYFQPKKYKVQLPYDTFKRITLADGFWAAKQIAAFSDDNIRTMVAAGKLTSKADEEFISKTLIERRDAIVQYWFSMTAPLDDFNMEGGKLVFKDLSASAGARTYSVTALNEKNKAAKTWTVNEPRILVDSNQVLEIRTSEKAPFVRVAINSGNVVSVRHQD